MIRIENLDFDKGNGLIPAVIIDAINKDVLMLGYMNKEALQKTIAEKRVTFFSRSKKRLWTKGETSGNFLELVDVLSDCDNDTLLIKVKQKGPVCHTGNKNCFNTNSESSVLFLEYLEKIIESRKNDSPEKSYTAKLFNRGKDRIVQKVGEEAVETIIAAKNSDKQQIIEETSDLLFHLLVMLSEAGINLKEIMLNLENRHRG